MDWNAVGHAALDAAGVFCEGADVINAIWYACEGNMEMAAASAICAIPGAGLAAGNLLMKSNKLAAAGRAVKAIAKLTQGTMGVCAGIETARTGFTNLLNGLEAETLDGGALLQTLGGIGIAVLSGKGLASSGRELLACTGNPAKTMKGRVRDADVSGRPVENISGATFEGSIYRNVDNKYNPLEMNQYTINADYRYTGKGRPGLYFGSGEKIVRAEVGYYSTTSIDKNGTES